MQGNSSAVISNQPGLHQQLAATVNKHLAHPFQRPLADHAKAALAELLAAWDQSRPLVLDSGCGTAQSTMLLAERHADCFVVGVDRSEVRLDKRKQLPANAILLRTNLEDFWRLLLAEGIRPLYHYLLYPNPYPKAAQLRYRWHGSPVFPVLMQLGGQLTLRSNWDVYLQEFQQACELAAKDGACLTELAPQSQPLTAFEAKYQASQQRLWELTISLS